MRHLGKKPLDTFFVTIKSGSYLSSLFLVWHIDLSIFECSVKVTWWQSLLLGWTLLAYLLLHRCNFGEFGFIGLLLEAVSLACICQLAALRMILNRLVALFVRHDLEMTFGDWAELAIYYCGRFIHTGWGAVASSVHESAWLAASAARSRSVYWESPLNQMSR